MKDAATEDPLKRLDRQVNDCLDAGVIPVIAYQADELKSDPSDKNLRQAEAWWRTVAAHFQSASYRLSFDLIIEVTDALNQQPRRLNEIYERLASAVRETNPERILMISPRLRSDAAYLQELEIPSQAGKYLMAQWHFYAAGPSRENVRKLWTTGTEAEKQLIQEKIDLALTWQKEHGVPTWVGAWMPGNYNDGDDYTISEQAAFAACMPRALTEAEIPFAVNADTHFYDRETNTWIAEREPVLSAIYGESTLPFTDVPRGAWYWDELVYVYESGLLTGTSSDTFGPDASMTRRQTWMVLSRMSGKQLSTTAQAGAWAAENGISDGSVPLDAVSRQQFVTFLWRLAGTPAPNRPLDGHGDDTAAAPYAREAMGWAAENGVIGGTADGRLMPAEPVTRTQAAVILARYLKGAGG